MILNFDAEPSLHTCSEFEHHLRDHFGPSREFIAWEKCRYTGWNTVFNAFFETHLGNVRAAKSSRVQIYGLPRPADKEQINYIISTYGMLNRFIRDYQSFVRSITTGNPPPLSDLDPFFRRWEKPKSLHWEVQDPRVWPPLSENEAIRLQRGFLRYELCSRSNAIATWGMELTQRDDHFRMDFGDSISKRLQRWEEEEIRCVWAYVRRQYQVLVREVVAEFRCDVRRLSRKARHASDNEVTVAPRLWLSEFDRWTYNMSCLGLPMLQQLLRSEFDDQRRFLKNTAFDGLDRLYGALSLYEENDLRNEWGGGREFRNLHTTTGATPIYTPVTMELARWSTDGHGERRHRIATERELEETGWVFWEDIRRLNYLGWLTWDTDAGNDIKRYLRYLAYRNHVQPRRFEAEDNYPEQSMYVTKDDYQEELSAKYAVDHLSTGRSHLCLDTLRDISDWPSKKISPTFQEVCQGPPTSR